MNFVWEEGGTLAVSATVESRVKTNDGYGVLFEKKKQKTKRNAISPKTGCSDREVLFRTVSVQISRQTYAFYGRP